MTDRFPCLLAGGLLMCAVGACGDEAPPAEETWQPEAPTPAPSRLVTRGDPLYGPDGELRESDTVIAGLRLPVGLNLSRETDRSHTYRSHVPIAKLQAYFGRRLMTGDVQRIGIGAVFKHAYPQGARGGIVHMDVSILPLGGSRTRVQIVELLPPPQKALSRREVLLELQKQQQRF